MRFLFLSLVLLFFVTTGASAENSTALKKEKFKVCTFTFGSSEEKDAFQKNLNPNHFEFVELVTRESSGFEQACASGVKCDIVIFSGHFSGNFSGKKSNDSLTLETLEKHRCLNQCPGILDQPSHVFLFGCSTLEKKRVYSETQNREERVAFFMKHGSSRQEAEENVEDLYGDNGTTNRSRFQNIFRASPEILGFKTGAPHGYTLNRYLEDYLKKKKNGDPSFLEKEIETTLSDRVKSKVTKLNHSFQNDFSVYLSGRTKARAVNCCGLGMLESCTLSKNEIELQDATCFLNDKDKGKNEKVSVFKSLYLGKNRKLYLPKLLDWLTRNHDGEEDEIRDALLADEAVLKKIKEDFRILHTPTLQMNLAYLGLDKGFFTFEEVKPLLQKEVVRVLNFPANIAEEETASFEMIKTLLAQSDRSTFDITVRDQDIENKTPSVSQLDLACYVLHPPRNWEKQAETASKYGLIKDKPSDFEINAITYLHRVNPEKMESLFLKNCLLQSSAQTIGCTYAFRTSEKIQKNPVVIKIYGTY